MNLSGLASILNDFVTWGQFFRKFIDTYRWAIRDPLTDSRQQVCAVLTNFAFILGLFILMQLINRQLKNLDG